MKWAIVRIIARPGYVTGVHTNDNHYHFKNLDQIASETILLCECSDSMDSHCVLLANVVVVIVEPIYLLSLARQAGSHMQARCLSL